MATKLARKFLKVFGILGNVNNFGKFGSETAGSPVLTQNVETIQGLSAWDNGWTDAIVASNKAPFIEDMNSAFYAHSYQTAYTLQEGIPEWDDATYYFIGSFVKKTGTGEIYISLTDSNLNSALPVQTDNTNWKYCGDLKLLRPTGLCRVYLSGQQSNLTDTAAVKILFDTISMADDINDFDVLTNHWFIAPTTGYYEISASLLFVNTVASKWHYIQAISGTNGVLSQTQLYSGTTTCQVILSDMVQLTAGEHLWIAGIQETGVSTVDVAAASKNTYFSIHRI